MVIKLEKVASLRQCRVTAQIEQFPGGNSQVVMPVTLVYKAVARVLPVFYVGFYVVLSHC